MATPQPRPRGVRRFFGRLFKSDHEIESDELKEDAIRHGGTHIAELADREVAVVVGKARTVTLRPRITVPALVVELYDGSESLNLVWVGRREIRGIEPGVTLQATGRVCHQKGVATIFNPSYEILPYGS